jgi:hypothetical protein
LARKGNRNRRKQTAPPSLPSLPETDLNTGEEEKQKNSPSLQI